MNDISFITDNLEAFVYCADWLSTYLAAPHRDLGRSGSVCPFVAPALAQDTLKIAVVRLPESGRRERILEAITCYRDQFLSMNTAAKLRQLQAIVILFPDVMPHETAELIDGIKEECKADFVAQGLMLGEFHADNQSPGLHNADFYPLRSRIPMLAIRRMVLTDYVFLNRSDYDAKTRLRYLETYLQQSGLPESQSRKHVERIVASLRAEVPSDA